MARPPTFACAPLPGPCRDHLASHRPLTKYTASASSQQQIAERAGRYMAQGEQGDRWAAWAVRAVATVSPSPPLGACCAPEPKRPPRPASLHPAVLLDVLQVLPTAGVVFLAPGEQYSQRAHVMLLRVRAPPRCSPGAVSGTAMVSRLSWLPAFPACLQGSLLAPASRDPLAAPCVLPWLPGVAPSFYGMARSQGPSAPQPPPVGLRAGSEGATLVVCSGSS